MRTRNLLQTFTLILALLALALPAGAVLVSESMLVHNSDQMYRTATDFHFTFSMPEFEMETFWFNDWTVTTEPYIGEPIFTPVYNTLGQVWKVQVDWYGLEIPYCTTIQVNVTGYLNAWNVLVKEDIFWTFDTPPYEVRATPDHMFQFPQVQDIIMETTTHISSYTIGNIDPITPIYIGDLRFYRSDSWCDPADWGCVDVLPPIHEEPGFQVLNPGESLTIELPGLPNTPGFIYVAGIMEYQMDGMGYETMEFRDGHEEEIPEIPEGCALPDNGQGTVDFPPECPEGYQGQMHIVDGLPPGTTIEIDATWLDFWDIFRYPGGIFGPDGEEEIFESTLEMVMTGTGDLDGFSRHIFLPASAVTNIGPRDFGAPFQIYPTALILLEGTLFGDPDFDVLAVRAGEDLGLPSPGETTLEELPGGDFNVDSFFDITYEIEFVGAPGGILEGLAGVTLDMRRFQIGEPSTATPEDDLAAAYRLAQCYPNPFNPETEIRFALPEATDVSLDVFSVDGRKVRQLLDGPLAAGPHGVTFDGRDDAGESLSSGVYFYRLIADDWTQTRSMTLLK